jgi:dolichol-phosphate mannosyltransferase
MKEKTFISVVTYIHNEEDTIIEFLDSTYNFFIKKFESFEIILVNDASNDKTIETISKQKDKYEGRITIITTAWKHGAEAAMLAGTNLAIGDFVYEIESTHLEFPITALWDAYKKCGEGYDIVFGSPQHKGSISSKLFYKILNKFSHQNLNLETDTFKIITRRALNAILKSKSKNRYRKILYKNSGFPSTTIHFHPTKPITSERTLEEKFGFAFEALLAFSSIGLKLSFWLSIIFFLASICIGIYTISIYLTDSSVVLGWTTTMLFLSFSFSGIFIVLTILGKYLAMILQEVKEHRIYTIQSIKRIK